jgi:hypothetical protein
MKTGQTKALIKTVFAVSVVFVFCCIVFVFWIAAPSHPTDNVAPTARVSPIPANAAKSESTGVPTPSRNQAAADLEFMSLVELAHADLPAAFKRIESDIPAKWRVEYRMRLAGDLLKTDFGNASVILQFLNDSKERQIALAEAIPIAFPKNRAAVKATVQNLTGEARGSALYYITNAELRAGDLAAAVQSQVAMPFSDARTSAISPVAVKLAANREVGLAVDWLKQLQPSDEQPIALRLLREEWTRTGYSEGLLRLLEMPVATSEREALVGALSILDVQNGGDGTLSQKGIEMTVREREQLIHRKVMADQSIPFEEKVRIAAGLKDTGTQNSLISAIVRRECELNPELTATKVMALPGSSRDAALPILIRTWAQVDVEHASDWIQRLPSSSEKEVAVESLAFALRYNDPRAAKIVASWLQDSARRSSVLKSLR